MNYYPVKDKYDKIKNEENKTEFDLLLCQAQEKINDINLKYNKNYEMHHYANFVYVLEHNELNIIKKDYQHHLEEHDAGEEFFMDVIIYLEDNLENIKKDDEKIIKKINDRVNELNSKYNTIIEFKVDDFSNRCLINVYEPMDEDDIEYGIYRGKRLKKEYFKLYFNEVERTESLETLLKSTYEIEEKLKEYGKEKTMEEIEEEKRKKEAERQEKIKKHREVIEKNKRKQRIKEEAKRQEQERIKQEQKEKEAKIENLIKKNKKSNQIKIEIQSLKNKIEMYENNEYSQSLKKELKDLNNYYEEILELENGINVKICENDLNYYSTSLKVGPNHEGYDFGIRTHFPFGTISYKDIHEIRTSFLNSKTIVIDGTFYGKKKTYRIKGVRNSKTLIRYVTEMKKNY